MDQFFQATADKLRFYDNQLAKKIAEFLKPYLIPSEGFIFASNIPLFIRIAIYLTALLIPLALIKIFFVDSHKLTILMAIMVVIVGFLTVGVLFGFFQLLYNFNF